MTFASDDEKRTHFAVSCFDTAFDAVAEWMAANLSPQDVFSREQLEDWARMNGWTPPPQE